MKLVKDVSEYLLNKFKSKRILYEILAKVLKFILLSSLNSP